MLGSQTWVCKCVVCWRVNELMEDVPRRGLVLPFIVEGDEADYNGVERKERGKRESSDPSHVLVHSFSAGRPRVVVLTGRRGSRHSAATMLTIVVASASQDRLHSSL